MKHRKNPRRNPDPLIVVAWAAGSAAVGAIVSYYVFREIAATKVAQRCSEELTRRGLPTTQTEQTEIRRQAMIHF
jgi:hypothetical protein